MSEAPLKVYGNELPVSADWVTMPEKAIIARRPLASSFSCAAYDTERVGSDTTVGSQPRPR